MSHMELFLASLVLPCWYGLESILESCSCLVVDSTLKVHIHQHQGHTITCAQKVPGGGS